MSDRFIEIPSREQFRRFIAIRQSSGLTPTYCGIANGAALPKVGIYMEDTLSTDKVVEALQEGTRISSLPKDNVYMTLLTCKGTGTECEGCIFYNKDKPVTITLEVPSD